MTTINKEKKYREAIGRRKRSVARVRLTPAKENSIIVNGKNAAEYFTVPAYYQALRDVFEDGKFEGTFSISVLVRGGGISAQAEAVRHGIARAAVHLDPESRKRLKKLGYLKRDPRKKERKKFGLKKARKAPKWSKR